MSSTSAPPSRPESRRYYLDWARGIAVLLMIEAHTSDAWTRAASRQGIAFRNATILGGFAAPLFLWLAGAGVAFSAARAIERRGTRAAAAAAALRRGVEIFLLAFLFRLQGFILTPGGSPLMLFRVDILNVMGPSIAAAGIVWALGRSPIGRTALLATCATAIALVTPIVRGATAIASLPLWLQWYVRPAGDLTTFTLFPWCAFVFGGAAMGAVLASTAARDRRPFAAFVACGVLLVAVGLATATRPSIYAAPSSFWTTSPTWFAIRAGVLMAAVAALGMLPRVAAAAPLERFGRASLFVYWIHVELVYGYASWLWRGRLPLWGTALAWVAFVVLMHGAILWRDSLLEALRVTPRSAARLKAEV